MAETPIRVAVYVKPGCTLCGPMLRTAERVRRDIPFELEEVDISGDATLMERHGNEVPVLMVNGRKAFKAHVTEQALKKRLKKEKELQKLSATAPQIDALEELEPPAWTPPVAVAALLLAATVGGFGYFVAQGVSEASSGGGKLAGQLLRIAPRPTSPVPFTLESITGKKVSLSDYRDKVVFLNFWATWCPPCVEEMPSMTRLHERLKNDPRVVFLAVSADESWAPVRKFFEGKEPPSYEVLLDANGKIAKEYGTTMFPETYVIKNGKIIAFIEGPRDWDRWYAEQYLRAEL